MKNKNLENQCKCENCQCGRENLISENPGRDVQRVGTAKFLGQNPFNIHGDVWAVIGNQGDSQCYLGVTEKVAAIQDAAAKIIEKENLGIRLIPSYFAGG